VIGSTVNGTRYLVKLAVGQYALTKDGRMTATDAGYGTASGSGTTGLSALVAEFTETRPYPSPYDERQIGFRAGLAAGLTPEILAAAAEDPSRFTDIGLGRLAANSYGSPGSQSQVHTYVKNNGDEGKQRVAKALLHLLHDEASPESDRIDDLVYEGDWKVPGLSESLAVKALAVVYPDRWLPLYMYTGPKGKKLLTHSGPLLIAPLDESEFETTGAQAVESNRRLREVLEPHFPGDPWGQMEFAYWLHERDQTLVEEPDTVASLATELLLDVEWLQETIELLRDKKQLIFYGPPGTGKTFVARRLAEYIGGDDSRVKIVQFHPSYAYEDFVEGFRPRLSEQTGATIEFEIRPGPLRQIAANAEASEDDWCLVIDEINRANIAKVFGELYYLLEYRDAAIDLQYGDSFSLPTNVYFIGTMNTADRSIALLDAALRRRFHFRAFFPDQPPVKGLLRRWLKEHRPDMEDVADLVDQANSLLPDRHLHIGPSHFMTDRLSPEWLPKIWSGSVIPFIEEQFFDEPDRLDAFGLEQLRAEQSTQPQDNSEGNGDSASSPLA
jgi:5-methylcytosine-specific restriction protein B